MASVEFEQVVVDNKDVDGLYVVSGTTSPQFAYVLPAAAKTPPSPFTLADAWQDFGGTWCFLPEMPDSSQYSLFVSTIRQYYQSGQAASEYLFLVWLAESDPSKWTSSNIKQLQFSQQNPQMISGGAEVEFCFRNATLNFAFSDNVGVLLGLNDDSDPTGFQLTNPTDTKTNDLEQLMTLNAASGTAETANVNNSPGVQLLLVPDQQGLFTFNVNLKEDFLDALDVGIRYYWDANSTPASQRYPLLNLPDSSTLYLTGNLDPWYAVKTNSAGRTNYSFREASGAYQQIQSYYRTSLGQTVSLTPLPSTVTPLVDGKTPGPPLLVFADQPAAAKSTAPCATTDPAFGRVTLTPSGQFTFAVSGQDSVTHFMPGLSGSEFFLAKGSDTIQFDSGKPAFAQYFNGTTSSGVPTGNPAMLVSESGGQTYETSWVTVLAGSNTDVSPDAIDFGYSVQPPSSVYFGTVSDANYQYPMALGARISRANATLPSVPMAPYGNAAYTGLTATSMPEFESTVLSASRRTIMNTVVDTQYGPLFFDPISNTALAGGYATTPDGLLLTLNDGSGSGPAGTWNQMELAKSPDVTNQELVIASGDNPSPGDKGVVNPALANALMNDQLFLVISDAAQLGNFKQNLMTMGEFTFLLDVDQPTKNNEDQYINTILIFKYTMAQSLQDLIGQPGAWWDSSTFIGSDVSDVQTQLNAWLTAATSGPSTNPDLTRIVTDPLWTGILAVNAGLDLSALPIDLQVLMGGIYGALRSSYFSVNTNQVNVPSESDPNDEVTTPDVWSIEKSSMGALINYQKEYTKHYTGSTGAPVVGANGFGFQVLTLLSQFDNSALSTFDSQIAMTIPTILTQDVDLQPAAGTGDQTTDNAIVINGSYQQQDGQGSVVFDTKTPRSFAFTPPANDGVLRVMNQLVSTDSGLVPVSSQNNTTTQQITVLSNFALAGDLDFTQNVNGSTTDVVDLFSYGGDNGLGFRNYNLNINTTIHNDPANKETYNTATLNSIGPDLGAIQIAASTASGRDESLMAALPFKLLNFEYSASGLNPAQAIFVVGSTYDESNHSFTVPLVSDSPENAIPMFALQYQLSLGGLGALSSVVDSLDVELLLGWKPGTTASEADQITLQFLLPQLMGGLQQFDLEGVLKTVFGNISLLSVTSPVGEADQTFVMQFGQVGVELLGINLLSKADVDFTLFADPSEGNKSNLGWLLTYKPS